MSGISGISNGAGIFRDDLCENKLSTSSLLDIFSFSILFKETILPNHLSPKSES
jgi:hypothetical protein